MSQKTLQRIAIGKKLGPIEKCRQVYIGEKEGKKLSAKQNTFGHDAENFGLVHLLETYSVKDSTMEQKLANCHALHDIASHKNRRVCVTIKNYGVNKRPYNQIRLFTAKENEVLKHTAYVIYTSSEVQELAQVFRDFMFE